MLSPAIGIGQLPIAPCFVYKNLQQTIKKPMNKKTKLPQERVDELFQILKKRFEKNSHRHPNVKWEQVQTKLESHPDKLWSLNEMEETG